MPSFAITGIAHRFFHRKKEADKKASQEAEPKSAQSSSSCYNTDWFPPNDHSMSPIETRSFNTEDLERFVRFLEGGGNSLYSTDSEEEAAPVVDETAERGVKQAEAIAAVWSKRALVCAYVAIFLVFFLCSLQQQIATNLTPYVTSTFAQHSLLATTQVVASIIGAVAKLPIAKIINIWGRAEGYILMVTICTIGLVMMATCNSVQMYCAAQVFYWIGYNGMAYVLQVFLADTSQIKNRGWLFAFSTSPYVVTAFAGPAAAQRFYKTTGWRWAFGTFAIAFPLVSAPIASIFLYGRKKAQDKGILRKPAERNSPSRFAWVDTWINTVISFDIIGIILIIAAFSLILLGISLGSYNIIEWKSATFICMLIFGVISLVLFGIWEKYYASSCIAPFELLTDRTVLAACLSSATMFISFYCWDMFFVSYLQVVYNQTIERAGYISNIYSIGGCLWAVIIGGLIRVTGRFKYIAMFFVPIQILGVGLMIFFRQPHTSIGFVIMSQVIISLSGGTLMICEEMAVMAAASHNDIAIVLALQGLFSNLGGAIGQTLSGAIWSQSVPNALVEYLPENAKVKAMEIYASLPTQLGYAMGTPEREAIMAAYSVGMRRMLVAAIALLPMGIVWVGMWRNIQLKRVTQVRGNVV